MDTKSSPRSWGCFLTAARKEQEQQVFPTLVGVFHLRLGHCLDGVGLPHARGGVSRPRNQKGLVHTSSPRSWGCFYLSGLAEEGETVFPTLVGVFLR